LPSMPLGSLHQRTKPGVPMCCQGWHARWQGRPALLPPVTWAWSGSDGGRGCTVASGILAYVASGVRMGRVWGFGPSPTCVTHKGYTQHTSAPGCHGVALQNEVRIHLQRKSVTLSLVGFVSTPPPPGCPALCVGGGWGTLFWLIGYPRSVVGGGHLCPTPLVVGPLRLVRRASRGRVTVRGTTIRPAHQ